MARHTSRTRSGVPDWSIYVCMYGVKGRDSSPCGSRPMGIIVVVGIGRRARDVVVGHRARASRRERGARSVVRHGRAFRTGMGRGCRAETRRPSSSSSSQSTSSAPRVDVAQSTRARWEGVGRSDAVVGAIRRGVRVRVVGLGEWVATGRGCLLYTSPSPRDRTRSRMPSSA